MDKFAEQLVKKYSSTSETMKKTLIVAAAIIGCVFMGLMCVIITTLSPLFILLAIGIIYGAFYLINMMHTEYEYEVTNGELDVAKIIAKKKRFELLSVNVKEFNLFKEFNENEILEDDGLTRYHCSDGTINHLFYADFVSEEGEKSRLYFSPSMEIIDAMIPFLKNNVKKDVLDMIAKQKEQIATAPAEDENEEEN